MGFKKSKFMTGMKSKAALKTLTIGALVGVASVGVAQAEDTNPAQTDKTYSIEENATETDYTYSIKDGKNVSYHKVELSKNLTTSDSITWEKVSEAGNDTVAVNLHKLGTIVKPETNYFKFTFESPASYTSTERVSNFSIFSSEGVLFSNVTGATRGGALYNTSNNSTTDVIAYFTGNSASYTTATSSTSTSFYGGALYNSGSSARIGNLKGVFIKNFAYSSSGMAYGGAIYNNNGGKISSVTSDFVSNGAVSYGSNAYGGAIYNRGSNTEIGAIKGDFVHNRAYSIDSDVYGGAVYNYADSSSYITKIASITGDFIGNYTVSTSGYAYGGAISNDTYYSPSKAQLGAISGDFIGNYAESTNSEAYGGAIHNYGTIGAISGDFVGNYVYAPNAYSAGGAIYNYEGSITSIKGDFINNASISKYDASGGALDNSDVIGDIEGDFIGNYAQGKDAYGGAISNYYGSIGNISGTFIGNHAAGTSAYGGAVYNKNGTIGTKDASGKLVGGFINSSFIGNYTHGHGYLGESVAGAVWTNRDLNFISDNGITEFRDNYLKTETCEPSPIPESERQYPRSAIAVDSNSATITFNLKNNGKTILKDPISGALGYNVNITGDGTGVFYLHSNIHNADVSIGNLRLLNTIDNTANLYKFNSLTLSTMADVVTDVDLANSQMDRFTATSYGNHGENNLNVIGMNMISDMAEGVDTTEILFAEQGLKDNVTYAGGELPHSNYQTELYTPIYKYNAIYENREDAGYFMFTKGDKIFVPTPDSGTTEGGSGVTTVPTGNASDAFNPAVLGSSTTAAVGATATMNTAFNYAFSSSADYMNIPYLERLSMKNRNRYALGNAIEKGRFSPLYQPSDEEASVWVKPYATFETVGLKNGPKVHNNTYGTLVGFDTQMQTLKHGWDRVITGYIGYNGASQRYSGVDSIQNGGLIGGTVTMYKGNFFNATTVSVGANVAQNETMYGKDDFAMLLSGVGNKTGYNFEFKEGKLILQPSMLMSYTFVNTFDYTNAAGVRIDNKPLHALQLAPGLKVIGNLKDGWQPYASVSMVWNLMGESDATANGVKLPEMSIKPYVQYGVGVQKRIKDHFTAYGQAMIQNGGRNGISLTGGFRWALGHDNCKYEKTQRQSDENQKLTIKDNGRKIIKQMTPQQRAAYGGKYQNTSRTAKSGSLRQY